MPNLPSCFKYVLLLVALLFSSCTGQIRENQAQPTSKTGPTRLPKAKGAFQGAAINCAVQDSTGRFWFGTNGEGLYLYDGITFTNYTEHDGFDHHFILCMLVDKAGNVWIGSRSGLCRYDGKSFIDVPLTHERADNSPAKAQAVPNGVWSMMQDSKGTIWFGTEEGVYCLDGTKWSYFLDRVRTNDDSLHLRGIFSFVEDDRGNVWLGSCIGEGLLRFDGTALKRISPKGYARTQGLVKDSLGNIWFASVGKGMCEFNGSTIRTNVFNEGSTYDLLYLFVKDEKDHLWFGEPSHNRLLRYYNGREVLKAFGGAELPNTKMYPLFEDRDRNIWFAAEGMKLFKWDGTTISNLSE